MAFSYVPECTYDELVTCDIRPSQLLASRLSLPVDNPFLLTLDRPHLWIDLIPAQCRHFSLHFLKVSYSFFYFRSTICKHDTFPLRAKKKLELSVIWNKFYTADYVVWHCMCLPALSKTRVQNLNAVVGLIAFAVMHNNPSSSLCFLFILFYSFLYSFFFKTPLD